MSRIPLSPVSVAYHTRRIDYFERELDAKALMDYKGVAAYRSETKRLLQENRDALAICTERDRLAEEEAARIEADKVRKKQVKELPEWLKT